MRAVLALALLVPVSLLGVAANMFWRPEWPVGRMIFLASKIWVAALPLIWLLWVDRTPLRWSPARHGGFGIAITLGIIMAALVLTAYAVASRFNALAGNLVADHAARIGTNQPALYFAGAVYWILLNSLTEEYIWRWFVFRKFETLLGSRLAVTAAAFAFTAKHVFVLAGLFTWPIVLLGALGVFVAGATWSWFYQRYRSIWPGYVNHAIVDVAIFAIGYWLIFGHG